MLFPSPLASFMPTLPYSTVVMPSGGSPAQWGPGIQTSLDSLTLQSESGFNIEHSPGADSASATRIPARGRSGEEHAGSSAVGRFQFEPSHQRAAPNLSLDRSGQFEDTPYVPPRVPQAEFQSYPAFHPRTHNVYGPPHHNREQIQYPCEGGTSPSDTQHSVESGWSASPSSSASSQQLPHDLPDPPSLYPQVPGLRRAATNPHYPAYYGQHRLGLEHVRYGQPSSNTSGSYYRIPTQNYSIGGLLSPEVLDDANAGPTVTITPRNTLQRPPSSSVNPTTNVPTFSVANPSTNASGTIFPDAGPYLRKQLGLGTHEPISLQSLPDPPGGEKPSVPLPILIKLAIYGSPNKQLTLQEIYTELESRFEWFRQNKHDKAWKNSIRHNLSLNKVFKNVPRPITEPGKGSYWCLDVSGGEGYKRPRKRRAKNRVVPSEEEEEDFFEMDEDRLSPLDAGPSQSSILFPQDTHLDPELRGEGHIVGEGRTRSTNRRPLGGSPYPSQSPRVQQSPLPIVAGQHTGAQQHPLQSGQPSFGQSSFPQPRLVPASSSGASFVSVSMSSAPTPSIGGQQFQQVATYNQAIPVPVPPERLTVEHAMDPRAAQLRVEDAFLGSQQQYYEDIAHSPSESLSSGSSQTWNDTRMMPRTQRNQ